MVQAYLRAKEAFPDRVSLNLLWALQAAVLDLRWDDLPSGMKEDLHRQVEAAVAEPDRRSDEEGGPDGQGSLQ